MMSRFQGSLLGLPGWIGAFIAHLAAMTAWSQGAPNPKACGGC